MRVTVGSDLVDPPRMPAQVEHDKRKRGAFSGLASIKAQSGIVGTWN